MIDGRDYWSEEILSKLATTNYKGREQLAYKNAPRNIYEDLRKTSERFPEKAAIVSHDGTVHSYRDFLARVDSFARYLHREEGIGKGDMIALMLYNTVEFCIGIYAAAKLGATVVPINTKSKPYEWHNLFGRLPIRLALLDVRLDKYREEIEQNDPQIKFLPVEGDAYEGYFIPGEGDEYYGNPSPEDDMIIMFTSGTTGQSKSVVMTHYNLGNAICSYEDTLDLGENDKTVIPTPIYHVTGLIALLMVFIHIGGTVYLQLKVDPEKVLQCCVDEGITLLHAAPTVFILLLEQKKKFPQVPSLRQAAAGSSNMPPQTIKDLHEWLPQMSFRTVYGLTESTSAGTTFPGDAAVSDRIGSSGRPSPTLRLKLVDDEHNEVPEGESGELAMYGAIMLDRYYRMQTPNLDEDGWFYSGDIARIDGEGYIYIIDRKKDMINRGGEKIYSHEVENVLYNMDGVLEAAVVGVPDPKYGEAVCAVIRAEEDAGITAEAVRDYVAERMAKFKVPAYVRFLEEFPKTATGKINKRKLRDEFEKI